MKKYLVYMKNDFTLMGKEYFKLEEGLIVGYHNPEYADHFDTIENANKLIEMISFNDGGNIKIGDVEKEIKKMKNTNWVYRKIKPINKKIAIPYDPNKMTKMDVLEWRVDSRLNHSETEVPYKISKTYPDLFTLFRHIWSEEVWKKNKNNILSFKIRIRRSDKITSFKKELNIILPKITKILDGYKVMSIMEHNLSYNGTYYFYYKSDKDCKIVNSYEVFKGSLEEVFEYMKGDLYYE